MGRRTKTLLPTSNQLLNPKTIEPEVVQKQLKQQQNRQKQYYDKHTKELPKLSKGDEVRIQSDGKWRPATVTEIPRAPRSYIVTTPEGSTYRRNRRHINKVPNNHNGDYLSEDDGYNGGCERDEHGKHTRESDPNTSDSTTDDHIDHHTQGVDLNAQESSSDQTPPNSPTVGNETPVNVMPTPVRRSSRHTKQPIKYDDTWSLHS